MSPAILKRAVRSAAALAEKTEGDACQRHVARFTRLLRAFLSATIRDSISRELNRPSRLIPFDPYL